MRVGPEIYFFQKDHMYLQKDANESSEFKVLEVEGKHLEQVPLSEMVIEKDTNRFLHISDCQERHFPFYDSRKRSYDFFQINLKERILIWSLDETLWSWT